MADDVMDTEHYRNGFRLLLGASVLWLIALTFLCDKTLFRGWTLAISLLFYVILSSVFIHYDSKLRRMRLSE